MKIVRNIINGEDCCVNDPDFFEKISPLTSEVIYKTEIANEPLVKIAIESARSAQLEWSRTNYSFRSELLFHLAGCLIDEIKDIAEILSLEMGRAYSHSESEVIVAAKQFRYQASVFTSPMGCTLHSSIPDRTVIVDRIPIGVVASLIPANTPLANIAWKVAPALIHGNSVVLKSPEETPLLTYEIVKILLRAGVPPGVLNCIHGPGEITGNALVSSDLIDLVSFTGSTKTGTIINQVVAKNLTKVSLELGGKNPFIVMNDCDINKAVEMVLESAYSNAGQRCSAASLLFIEDGIYPDFISKFIDAAKAYQNVEALQKVVGPLLRHSHVEFLTNTISASIQSGNYRLLFGGAPAIKEFNEKGCFFWPTAIEVIKEDVKDPLLTEELFGPILTIGRFEDKEELIEKLNNLKYGLTCAIHTLSIENIKFFQKNLRFGVINFNGKTFGSEPHFPFGGLRKSGNGTREPGFSSLDIYTEQRNVSL